MSIKDKIKEIEAASEELMVPEHEGGVIGELVKEANEASKEMFSKGHKADAGEVIADMVRDTANAATEMLGKDHLKTAPEGKLDELAKEIEDAADVMLENK